MKEKIDVTGFWNFTQGKKDGLGYISFSLIDLIKGCIGEPDEKIDPDMKKQFHAPQKTNNAMVIWKIYKEYQLST